MVESTHSDVLESLFTGDGEMCTLMRSHDWSQTPLGPVEQWPQSLRTTVSILLNSRYPMFTFWGPQLVKLYNDGYRPVLGVKHPDALGRPGPEIWPEIWDAIGPLVDQVITQGKPTWDDNLLLFMHRNGYLEETYFTFSYSPVRDETGGIGGMFCACTETTQQVLSERRLRTLRDLAARAGEARTVERACQLAMQSLVNNPADIPFALLYCLDAEGQQAHLAGTTRLEAGHRASPPIMVLSELISTTWPLAQVMQSHQVEQVDDVIERFGPLPGGAWDESPHTALVIPVAASGQEQTTAVLIVGINPRRALDDDYQGFLQLVAGQVASAIADARAYETERQRAEALAEIDRAKTVFFSNVSHEFRTPLTLILAPTEDALGDDDEPLPPAQRARIELIQRNSLRLLKLVNALLDFSRIEADRIQAVYEPTDLATLTTDLASVFRSLVEQAGLSFVVECQPPPEPVYVDRDMWEKIVLNLLSNAFKFTLSGEIAVRLYPLPAANGSPASVCLEVQDTGIGIPPQEIPHLFERFHRVKGSQGRSFEGSGIGLSLVQELVKLHGGHIEVTSALGQGSCFSVYLPTGMAHLPIDLIHHEPGDRNASCPSTDTALKSANPYIEEASRWLSNHSADPVNLTTGVEPNPPVAAFRPLPNHQLTPTHTSGGLLPARPYILVVDDNADMRDYLKRLLEYQYDVDTADDGVVALTVIQQRIPNLVLTDVMMPRLDGFGLLQALRTNTQTRELPIIILSARSGEEARIAGLATGADDYLVKPFSGRELLARVEACLKLAHIRQEAAIREQSLRQVAEQAQQQSEAMTNQLSHILESMSDGFIALDHDWRITYQNAASERISKKPRAEIIGRNLWDEWPAAIATNLEYQYRRAVSEQVPVHFEHHYDAPPKYDLWLEIHAYPTNGGLGIFYRDITERKQAETALQDNQRQLQQQLAEIEAIYLSAPVGLNFLDTDLRFVRINQRLADMHGLSVDAHLGRTIRELLPDLADATELLLQTILETGEPLLNVEITGETPAQPGVQRTWLEHFFPLKAGDQVMGINTVCEEITERKRIEAEQRRVEEELRQAKEDLEQRVAERTTELEQMNADLQQSESILRSFFNSTAMCMGIVEVREQDILHISDNWAAAQFFGTTPEAMQYHFASELGVAPVTIQQWLGYYRQSASSQAPVKFDYLHTDHKGQRWLSASVCEIAASASGYPRFSYIVEDISDRKHSEAQLAYNEEQLRLTLEFTHIGTWDWNIQTNEVIWNENHFRLLGLEPQSSDGLYQLWRDAIDPEDVERVEQALLDALNQHTDYQTEYRIRHPDGSLRWLVGKGRGVYNAANEPIRMLGVIIDVSERKQAEQLLDLQAVITRNMAEGICLVRADNGIIVYANPKFEYMFGYDSGELNGQHVSIVNYAPEPTVPEAVNQAIRAAVLTQGEATYEVHNVKKDGTPFCCSATTSVFEHPLYGKVLVAVQQDITDRKQAQDRIQASLQEKEVLLKEIHHRVKNNLSIVSSLLQMQARRTPDAQATTILRDSQSRIDSIALVHEKLYRSDDLSNINFTQYIKDLTVYLFDSYNLSFSQVTLNIQVEEIGLDIETAVPCGLIINELVSNALKYAFPDNRPGEIEVKFYQDRTGVSRSDQHPLVLIVRDDGIGLPPDLDIKTTKTLGIQLVQGLVQQIKGDLMIHSNLGTEFKITFAASSA